MVTYCVTFWKDKIMETIKISMVARGKGWIGKAQRSFTSVKNTLYDTMRMDTCHYTFVQTHRMYSHNVNHGLWVITTCQCRFVSFNKCTTVAEDADNEAATGLPGGSAGNESACNAGDLGWQDPLEKGMATHSSVLAWRISMDRGAWRAAVQGVAKSWTWLSDEAD